MTAAITSAGAGTGIVNEVMRIMIMIIIIVVIHIIIADVMVMTCQRY
jgi:hypothetical protein